MTKSGFDIDELERRARAYLFQECQPDRGDVFSWLDDRMTDFMRYVIDNSLPAMIAEIRELRAENARLRGKMTTPDDAMIEAGEQEISERRQYGERIFAEYVWRAMSRAALGEPQ